MVGIRLEHPNDDRCHEAESGYQRYVTDDLSVGHGAPQANLLLKRQTR
jgi:hypothetical protein